MQVWRLGMVLLVARAFYLPGVAPKDYQELAPVKLLVNKLDSSETQLPFDYYYLNFCKPKNLDKLSENLGQILQGDRIESSAYDILMNKNETCASLCQKKNKDADLENFKWMIDNQYRVSWVMDNLPAGLRWTSPGEEGSRVSFYQDGFPIGMKEGEKYFVYNHVHIIVKVFQSYEQDPSIPDDHPSSWRIVGFLVQPMSLESVEGRDACDLQEFAQFLSDSSHFKEIIATPETVDLARVQHIGEIPPMELQKYVNYTYSVAFENSDVPWASRWEHYLYNGGKENQEVHWLSIINSFAMVLFLSGMVAHILGRTLKKDIALYNQHSDQDEIEESGWKQVHGDVFRPPVYFSIFSLLIGSGVQLIGMCIVTLLFASLGFLSPAHRGGLVTTMMLLFVFMGIFSGYASSRLYKLFGGEHWKRSTLSSAIFLPGGCFSVFFIINLFIWGEESSGAVPFLHLLSILVLWIGISVPLVFLGSAIGYKKQVISCPCKVSRIPKPMNIIPGAAKLKMICVLAGSLPFGCVLLSCMFIELSYVMKSLWHHTLFYYLFGFLFLCFLVLVVTSAEVSILMTYIMLCREDYRWWWLSFGVAGSSGLYLFAYAVIYYLTQLTLTRLSSLVIYFGYMLIASGAYALVTGTIGFYSTFFFIRTIYGLIKVE